MAIVSFFIVACLFWLLTRNMGDKKESVPSPQKKEEKQAPTSSYTAPPGYGWEAYFDTGVLMVERAYAGEIRFGPEYFNLKSTPGNDTELKGKIFGDWKHEYDGGSFLQLWKSTQIPDTSLVYLDKQGRLYTLFEELRSVQYSLKNTSQNNFEFSYHSGGKWYKHQFTLSED